MATMGTVPRDLGPEGRALWRGIAAWLDDRHATPDPWEVEIFTNMSRQVDRLAAIRVAMGELTASDPQWIRLASEERQGRVGFARMVAQAGLPTGLPGTSAVDGRPIGQTPRSRRAVKAAEARWSRQRRSDGESA